MSEDETDTEDIDIEDLAEDPSESEHEPELFEELPNLFVSRRLELCENWEHGEQRPRGILSKTDREYLLGAKNYANKQSEANRRQDIRDRIKNSLKDFKIIWALLEEDDREQVFSSLGDESVDNAIEAMVSFMYLGLDGDIPRIEKAIKRGILAGENATSEGETKQIDVSINIDYYPEVEAAKERMQKHPLGELTVEEIGVLAKANELEQRHIEEKKDSHIYASSGEPEYINNQNTEDTDDLSEGDEDNSD